MERTVNIKGNQIAYTVEGDPSHPSLILIHDWASHRAVWRQTMQAFCDRYYCISVDLLGFGASDKPSDGDFTLTGQAQRVLLAADRLGLNKFILLGHSMGGQIGILLAAALAPERIDKLILVNSIVTGKFSSGIEKTFPFAISFMRKIPWLYTFLGKITNIRYFGLKIFSPWFYKINDIPFEAWNTDRMFALNPANYISLDESLKTIHNSDLTQNLRKIKAETLIISGSKDRMVPQDQSLLAQTLIPNNNLAILENCGHFPMIEKPGIFLKALKIIL